MTEVSKNLEFLLKSKYQFGNMSRIIHLSYQDHFKESALYGLLREGKRYKLKNDNLGPKSKKLRKAGSKTETVRDRNRDSFVKIQMQICHHP